MKEITQRGDIILFIGELHNLVGAGAAEGAIDAASILKPRSPEASCRPIGDSTSTASTWARAPRSSGASSRSASTSG